MNIHTEFEKELLERIGNIESRLESIEQMLGAESKPEQLYRVDTKARSLLTPVPSILQVTTLDLTHGSAPQTTGTLCISILSTKTYWAGARYSLPKSARVL